MTRRDFRNGAGLGLSLFLVAYVGCSSGSSSPTNSDSATPTPAPAGHSPGKVLANLGNPSAVLIISGQQEGYQEPCGCSDEQIGGLLRRYDLVERIHSQHDWPTVLIDLGGLIKDPAVARGGFEQTKFKFDYSARALALLKYSALALGPDDLKIGVGEALGLLENALGETPTRVVLANVHPADVYERLFKPSFVVQAGPVKVGITGVIDPELLQKLNDPEKDSLLPRVSRPDDVLRDVLADLQSKSNYQVLMVQGSPELAERLATTYPGFDVVVSTSEFADPLNHEPQLLNGGKTMLVSVGKKGKYVGVFGLYPDQPERLKYQLVTLNRLFDGPATPMKRLIENEYREMLKIAGVVKNYPRHEHAGSAPGTTFAGAAACKSCHPNTYMRWSTTKHPLAFESLKKDPKPNTVYDAECVSCHTTGFEYNSGWHSEEQTPHLAGNQCENCHGPASKHVTEPDNAEFRKPMHLSAEQADKNGLCIRCHDEENSRNFEFTKYWSQIAHKGLDTYTDPAVHRGITPRAPKAN
jgi:hypothetical protein